MYSWLRTYTLSIRLAMFTLASVSLVVRLSTQYILRLYVSNGIWKISEYYYYCYFATWHSTVLIIYVIAYCYVYIESCISTAKRQDQHTHNMQCMHVMPQVPMEFNFEIITCTRRLFAFHNNKMKLKMTNWKYEYLNKWLRFHIKVIRMRSRSYSFLSVIWMWCVNVCGQLNG